VKQKDSYEIGFSLPGCLHNGNNLDGLRNDGHVGEDASYARFSLCAIYVSGWVSYSVVATTMQIVQLM
jgi:hypothetical protein